MSLTERTPREIAMPRLLFREKRLRWEVARNARPRSRDNNTRQTHLRVDRLKREHELWESEGFFHRDRESNGEARVRALVRTILIENSSSSGSIAVS